MPGYVPGMTTTPAPQPDERESDQLPETQPRPAGQGTPSTPARRKRDAGLDPRPDPGSRRNTGNAND
jgi:hypothetical protein